MTPDPHQSIASQSVAGYLDALNSGAPTPGGGAVAGTNGATAAAIAGMVVHFTLGKKKYAEFESENQSRLSRLSDAQSQFLSLADDDATGYGVLNALWSLPESDPARQAGWDDAVAGAITPPTSMLALSVQVLRIVNELTGTTNRMLRSDLEVAAITGKAAAHSAACSIRVNIPLLPEGAQSKASASMDDMLAEVDQLHNSIVEACR
tara:strand:- start:593 stop:1213 length:621 start_codon:yes stop_codon:yes gene_type:complete